MDHKEINQLTALAAKAVGGYIYVNKMGWIEDLGNGKRGGWWNPGLNDGDAFRLAIRLGLYISNEQDRCGAATVSWGCDDSGEHCGFVVEQAPAGGDDCAATRLAILRAAAAIGEAMQ